MASVGNRTSTSAAVAPRLIILTGASHTGKTSVARELTRQAPPPVAYLSVDEILSAVLTAPSGSIWEQIPLAYRLMHAQAGVLLEAGWLTILESTFTYVPEEGAPELHLNELQRLVELAEQTPVPLTVARLEVPSKQLIERVRATGRLDPNIAAQTAALHEEAEMPATTLRLDASSATAEQLASQVLSSASPD
ncbi:MAG TPA: AAA family ATPase [Solirubrobacterales bacterium]|nr:AAA family ATPase [Solirubrobacterales bacterium]